MFRRKRSTSDIAVPQNVYQHLQAGFAESNARRCVEYERDRIFHPTDAFIDVLRWLWGGIEGGEIRVTPIDGPVTVTDLQQLGARDLLMMVRSRAGR